MEKLYFNLEIYRRLISIGIRGQMQYRASFFLELFATGSTFFMYFGMLALVFQRFQSLGGWTLGEIAFLVGMAEAAFGLMDMIFSGFDPNIFSQRVRRGSFDQLLLRPVNITTQVLGSKFVLRRLGRTAQGIVIFIIALNLVDVHWTVFKLLYLPLVIVGLIAFFGGLSIFGSALTFWTIESMEATNILISGSNEMISYPMHIYPSWLRRIFTYIIPAIFLNYYPALYLLDRLDPLSFPYIARFIAPLIGLLCLMAALAFWRFGIRHYQSTGS